MCAQWKIENCSTVSVASKEKCMQSNSGGSFCYLSAAEKGEHDHENVKQPLPNTKIKLLSRSNVSFLWMSSDFHNKKEIQSSFRVYINQLDCHKRNLFSPNSQSQKSKIKVLMGLFSCEPPSGPLLPVSTSLISLFPTGTPVRLDYSPTLWLHSTVILSVKPLPKVENAA